MPRKPRINIPGYYHVLNRGVNREHIFLDDDDKNQFLEFVELSREMYHFTLHSFCVLDNHYHLLIETSVDNLSLAIRYINSRYAEYFNKKNRRVGPLWQGRFKSWYVHDENYLWLLIRYIELNPVKAGLCAAVGEYPFSSSYFVARSLEPDLLISSLLYKKDIHSWLLPLSESELAGLEKLNKNRFDKNGDYLVQKMQRQLHDYFLSSNRWERNEAIYEAFLDGYIQGDIARYLGMSSVSVSRIISAERAKRKLFIRLRDKGLFWSYAPDIQYHAKNADLLIETALKYADLDDIKSVCGLYGIRRVRRVWNEKMTNDLRFKKLNYFLARVLFGMDVEADYFAEDKNSRGAKLRLLAG